MYNLERVVLRAYRADGNTNELYVYDSQQVAMLYIDIHDGVQYYVYLNKAILI